MAVKRKQRAAFARRYLEVLESRILFSFSVTATTSAYTVDTGAGLVFSVARTAGSGSVGDLTSTKLNGTQLEASFSATSRYSHYESGLGSGTMVTATVDPGNNWVVIACNDTGGTGVIQYYVARSGYNNIYMATYAAGPNSPSPGEMRFITYTNHSVLTNAPPPSDNNGSTGAIESSDIFGHANGTTSSKYYGEYRAIDTQTYGLTGGGFGEFMNIGNRETSSGGPFFKDIDFQTTSAQSTELYTYVFSGHSQTENFRPGLKGFYALMFTTGSATPAAPDYSWIDSSGLGSLITGYVGASGRGVLTGTASGVPSGNQVTVALSNAADQYWGTPDASGNYMITGILPGTYTETLYQNELAVGTTTVTIAASKTTTKNIIDSMYTPAAANTVFTIGQWDGTPLGFLNSDKITTMHPTDGRMSPWAADATGVTNFVVGTDAASSFPMAEWHSQAGTTQNGVTTYEDTDNKITFTLTAAQAATAQTLRVGLTRLDSGRPTINVNSGAWSSAIPSIASQPSARGLTTGNWRGNNVVYSFDIGSGALHAGTNTIDIFCTSGSSGTIYAGYQIYDAIDLVSTASAYPPAIASVLVTPSSPTVAANGTQTFTAVAKDASGNVIPANFTWSAANGTIDNSGNYAAPATGGSDTINVIATTTGTPGYKVTRTSNTSFSGTVTLSGGTTISVLQNSPGFGISPATSVVLPGGTLQLMAGSVDASGNVTTPASNATWSILSGGGTVTSSGIFLAPTTPGTTFVEVNAAGNQVGTAAITVASATAWYAADTANGTALLDSSGGGHNGTLSGTFSYSAGVSGNALSLNGGYATLPAGIVSGLSNFTISAWINPSSLANWARVFDFGTGTSDYMFLTADAGGTNALRFGITATGNNNEQQLNGPAISANTWTQVAVTLSGTTATMYVNGVAVATNANMTLSPSSLGNTTLNYLGKSQFPNDPTFAGAIDDFRIYPVALSAQQVLELAAPTIISPASTPAPTINSTTANLTVTATDVTAGEAALVYTWSAIGTPPAPVNFTNNGANAGKNSVATFSKAGVYTLQVAIRNPAANITTTSNVTLTVFPGDANRDGQVDLNDLNIVLNNLGQTSSEWTSGNFDGAATIDLNDLNAVLNNLGTSLGGVSSSVTTVSEPVSGSTTGTTTGTGAAALTPIETTTPTASVTSTSSSGPSIDTSPAAGPEPASGAATAPTGALMKAPKTTIERSRPGNSHQRGNERRGLNHEGTKRFRVE